jgi:hypothetical protein
MGLDALIQEATDELGTAATADAAATKLYLAFDGVDYDQVSSGVDDGAGNTPTTYLTKT